MPSSEPATFNRTRWGDIPKLTQANYDESKDDMILILSAMTAYTIVTGEDPEPQPLDFDHHDNYDDWKAKETEAASIIRLSCSPEVRRIVKGISNPHEMWKDTGNQSGHRWIVYRQTRHSSPIPACQSKEDEPLKAYVTKHSNYCTQLDHSDDAINYQSRFLQANIHITAISVCDDINGPKT